MSELRYEFLKDLWVIMAPERGERPHGYVVDCDKKGESGECPFDPGREDMTPPQVLSLSFPGDSSWAVRVVKNKYPALSEDEPYLDTSREIYRACSGFGVHEVVVDTPEHSKQLYEFTVEEFKLVLAAFKKRMKSLSADRRIKYISVFKNHGRCAGGSLVHLHSQILAVPQVPSLIKGMLSRKKEYFEKRNSCYLCDEASFEVNRGERIVYENEHVVSYCPFASAFPFQVRIVLKRHFHNFADVDDLYMDYIADSIISVAGMFYKLLDNPSYNLVLYNAPTAGADYSGIERFFHWYFEFFPRVVIHGGFEMGTGWFINPVLPEDAALLLKGASPG